MPFTPPLKGIRVVELTHTILGPSCGMILGDLGAEVIKVEPVDGDRTRKLKGFGGGFFGYFNRNKQSLALDADAPEGRAVLVKLLQSADVHDRELRAGLDEQARAGARASGEDQSAAGLLRAEGLPARALREAARARRGRADDGRARLHDRPIGPALARRHLGGRHPGRPVRRLRHGAGAAAARAAPARAGWSRARCSNRWCS